MAQYLIELPHTLDRDDPEGPIEITIFVSVLHSPSTGFFHHIDSIWTEPPIAISPSREIFFKDLAREQI